MQAPNGKMRVIDVVDGATCVAFLQTLKAMLEEPVRLLI
jgi:hypothetical protein